MANKPATNAPTDRPKGSGPDLDPYQVILRPIVTEKGTHQATSEHQNAYAFEVNRLATKSQIKAAAEELFNVRVLAVRTQNRAGKVKRFRNRVGRLSDWKKAVIKLHPDDKLELY